MSRRVTCRCVLSRHIRGPPPPHTTVTAVAVAIKYSLTPRLFLPSLPNCQDGRGDFAPSTCHLHCTHKLVAPVLLRPDWPKPPKDKNTTGERSSVLKNRRGAATPPALSQQAGCSPLALSSFRPRDLPHFYLVLPPGRVQQRTGGRGERTRGRVGEGGAEEGGREGGNIKAWDGGQHRQGHILRLTPAALALTAYQAKKLSFVSTWRSCRLHRRSLPVSSRTLVAGMITVAWRTDARLEARACKRAQQGERGRSKQQASRQGINALMSVFLGVVTLNLKKITSPSCSHARTRHTRLST